MRIVLLLALLLVGCKKEHSGYCEGDECPEIPCTTSEGTCVCLTPPGVCVECTAADTRNCTDPAEPACGSDNKCRACSRNDECGASGACLEDGTCADVNRIIYASPTGVDTAGCGRTGLAECSIARALMEVDTTRNIIRLAAGTYTVPNGVDGLDFSAKSATVVARGATLTRPAGPGAMMSVRLGQTLKIVGGTLKGPNNTTDGLRCNNSRLLVHEAVIEDMLESGIETDTCELTLSRSTLRGNDDGGIKMNNTPRPVTITNNFVYNNGNNGSPVGGMTIRLVHPGSKVEFNTVVDNDANLSSGTSGGITCEGPGYDLAFNLVYRNVGGLGGIIQIIGSCTSLGSYQKEAATPDENVVGFERPNDGANPSYRLTTASPVGTIRDAFDCRDVIDFEGDARPQGTKCDYGADELRMGQ